MRGKPVAVVVEAVPRGLIPAHAGKTTSSSSAFSLTRAHPRSRGENPSMPGGTYVDEGSSPLMQGKPGRVHGVTESLGLIPAHAGKTKAASHSVRAAGAHPRSCGENLIGVTADLSAQGSSPLMRGKRVARRFAGHLTGLIPAHAGKPSSGSRRASGGRAHPRSCGENLYVDVVPSIKGGSSPLMRGKLRPLRGRTT